MTAPSAGRRLEPDAHDINAAIKSRLRAIKAIIPSISTRKIGLRLRIYAERNLVERFFNAIKHYRGIATRYEKTARHFLAGLHLVCAHRLAQMTIDPS
jgi:transposase